MPCPPPPPPPPPRWQLALASQRGVGLFCLPACSAAPPCSRSLVLFRGGGGGGGSQAGQCGGTERDSAEGAKRHGRSGPVPRRIVIDQPTTRMLCTKEGGAMAQVGLHVAPPMVGWHGRRFHL
ncbi:hypothetical protein PVAP13_3NG141327 [Panicum virgatum]|uniref:Uncharacterized protein n=1 Tax=Panicum virgatum TaxID=38727 RepID=A0A8T0UED2_PANVG|nr:hypothetical protein PVAP13_3NG141327 [Panicum virgatum]